ncbi:MAG TPA: hypothetical protein VLH56_02580 [Dissulfurispiraceae bacterium]|nr:hypothetical protein [Dissulfurispiraceae bacterium]
MDRYQQNQYGDMVHRIEGKYILYTDHLAEIAALLKRVAYLETKDEQWRGLCETCQEKAALQDKLIVANLEIDHQEQELDYAATKIKELGRIAAMMAMNIIWPGSARPAGRSK